MSRSLLSGRVPLSGRVLGRPPQNLLTHSDFYNAGNGFSYTGISTVTGSVSDPFGGTHGARVAEDTANSLHTIQATTQTAKARGYSRISVWARNVDIASNQFALGTFDGDGIFTLSSGGFVSFGGTGVGQWSSSWTMNSYRRFSVVTLIPNGTNWQPYIYLSSPTNYLGTGKSMEIAGFQVEFFSGAQPSAEPGDYKETTGTAVTAGNRRAGNTARVLI